MTESTSGSSSTTKAQSIAWIYFNLVPVDPKAPKGPQYGKCSFPKCKCQYLLKKGKSSGTKNIIQHLRTIHWDDIKHHFAPKLEVTTAETAAIKSEMMKNFVEAGKSCPPPMPAVKKFFIINVSLSYIINVFLLRSLPRIHSMSRLCGGFATTCYHSQLSILTTFVAETST